MSAISRIDRGPSIPRVLGEGGKVLVPPRHPEHAYVRPDGIRELDMETSVFPREDGVIVYSEYGDRKTPVAVVIELNAEGVEWLLSELPPDDRFTKSLAYARDLARVVAWDEAAAL
jgi:hypothetical protein